MSVIDETVNDIVDQFMFNEDVDNPKKEKKPEKKPDDFVETESSIAITPATHKTKKYSEMFGWDEEELKGKKDFDCIYYEPEDWDEEDRIYIPKLEDFDGHVVDHRAMYPFALSQQPQFKGFTTLTVGSPGCGKSSGIEYYCAVIGQPFLRVNGRGDMESDSLIGCRTIEDGTMGYKIGSWPKASKQGWFVLIDEPWKIPSHIWMVAQRPLECGGIWQLDDMPTDNVMDKQIVPKSTYRCVLADNVVGTGDDMDKFGATMIQDGSTLNRVDMVVHWPYLKPADEVALLQHRYPAIPEHNAKKMVNMLNLLRTGYDNGELSSAASIRNIEAWAKIATEIRDFGASFRWVLLNRYAEDSERAAVENHYFTVFGEKL